MKHLKNFHQINESRLKIHPNIESFLYEIRDYNTIARTLLNMRGDETAVKTINFLAPSDQEYIFFSQDNKHLNDNEREFNWSQQKDKIKIGRAIKKILAEKNIQTSDKRVEEFVNLYKSFFLNRSSVEFDLVEGEEIRYWYLGDNYNQLARDSNLGKSCMAYKGTQPFLDLYVYNPEVCKLAILKDDGNRLLARVLVWTTTDGKYFIDRLYYTQYWNSLQLEEWINNKFGKENTISYQEIKSTYSRALYSKKGKLDIQLTKWKMYRDHMDYYPYLDSLRYLDYNTGILTSYDGEESKPFLSLVSTTGGYNNPFGWVLWQSDDSYIKRSKAQWNKEEGWVPMKGFKKFKSYIKSFFESLSQEEMDELLDQINNSGVESLTPSQKRKMGIIEDLSPTDSIIETIKSIIEETGMLTTSDLELDASPVYKEGTSEIHLIERFNQNNVTVVVYGGYKLQDEIDEYEVPYNELNEDTLEDILKHLEDQKDFSNWRDNGFPFED